MINDFPEKEYYKYFVKDKNGKEVFEVEFEQGTYREYLNFIKKEPQKQSEELTLILINKLSGLDKLILKKTLSKIDIQKELSEILSKKYKSYKSIYSDIKDKNTGKQFGGGTVLSLTEKTNYKPDEIYNLTLEQFLYLCDGLRWNNNSQYKEGIRENKMVMIDKKEMKKKADKTREAFAKIRNLTKK